MNKTCETNVRAILSKKGLQHRTLYSTYIGAKKILKDMFKKRKMKKFFLEESIIGIGKMNKNK